jgi:hypothetical protein
MFPSFSSLTFLGLSRRPHRPTPSASARSGPAGSATQPVGGRKASSRSRAEGAAVVWWRPVEGSDTAVVVWWTCRGRRRAGAMLVLLRATARSGATVVWWRPPEGSGTSPSWSGMAATIAPLDRAKEWRRSQDLLPPPSTRTVRREFGEK